MLLASWRGNDPCDKWLGVHCDTSGAVTGINLCRLGLNGTLDPAIGNLSSLQALLISDNNVTCVVPASIASLSPPSVCSTSRTTPSPAPCRASPKAWCSGLRATPSFKCRLQAARRLSLSPAPPNSSLLSHCLSGSTSLALRQAMTECWDLPSETNFQNTDLDWLLMILDRHSEEINANLLMVLWRVWNVRNGVLQAGENISIGDSVEFLKRYMAALLQIRQQEPVPDDKGKKSLFRQKLCSMPRAVTTDKRWVPPDKNVLKINVDGAFMESSGAAAVGVVIRDNTGSPLLTAWRILFYCRDAEEAEITACLEGIKLAARWDDREFILETDWREW
ncbi:hypothetical protein EJB05_05069, partial [Eragrostis curvula]